MLIWIIIFVIIILISSVLAYRSMKDYEEVPDDAVLMSVFYIRSPENFKAEVLRKLYEFLLPRREFFSIEKLYKGKEKALVLFGPRDLTNLLPELNLIELEDYLVGEGESYLGEDTDKKVDVNRSITWLVEPKNNSKRQIHAGSGLNDITVGETQNVFIQAVCFPEKESPEPVFQTTWRIMVADKDSIDRVALAKKAETAFASATGLNKSSDPYPESKRFESFKQRSLVPKEVAPFPMVAGEIAGILAG